MSNPANIILDFDGWLNAQDAGTRDQFTRHLSSLDEEQRPAEKQRIASMYAVADATGKDLPTINDRWDLIRGGFAEQYGFPLDAKENDAKFFAFVHERATQREGERVLLSEGDDGLVSRARKAAYEGRNYGDALADWEAANKGKPGYDDGRASIYAEVAAREHNAMAAAVAKVKPIATQAYDRIAVAMGAKDGQTEGGDARPVELFRGLDNDEMRLAFRMIADRAEAEKAGEGKLDWQAFAEAIGRGFGKIGDASEAVMWRAELSRSKFAAGDTVRGADALEELNGRRLVQEAPTVGPRTQAEGFLAKPERKLTEAEAADWNKQREQLLEDSVRSEQLLKIAQETIDPTNKTGSATFRHLVLPMADSAALLSTLAIPGATIPAMVLNAQGYQNDEYIRLRGDGMEHDEAYKLAAVTGTAQAALDKLELGVLGKLGSKWLPQSSSVLRRFAVEGSPWARLGVNVAGTTAAETGIELLQDQIIPAAVQDAFTNDPRFDVRWGDVWSDVAKALPETALGMVLLSAGGGALQTHDQTARTAYARELSSSPATMRLRGYSLEQIDEVQAAPELWQKADLLEKYDPAARPAPQGADLEKLKAETIQLAQRERETFTEKQRVEAAASSDAADYAVSIKRNADGWQVQMNGGKSVTVDSAEAARRIREDLKQAEKQADAEAFVALVDRWHESAPQGVSRETTVTGETVKPTEGGTALQRVHVATGEERIQPLNEKSIQNLREEAQMDARATGGEEIDAAVNGTNLVFREQVGERAGQLVQRLEINQSDSAIATFLHESFEADTKAAIESGALTNDEIQGAIAKLAPSFDPAATKDKEERAFRERLQRVARGEGNASELRETLTELAVADTFGRRKDGSAFPAGSVTAGLDRLALNETDPRAVRRIGKIRAFIQAVKAKLRAIFGTVAALKKARREGDATAFDEVIAKVTGLSEQAKYERELVAEAEALARDAGVEYTPPSDEELAAGVAFSLSRPAPGKLSPEMRTAAPLAESGGDQNQREAGRGAGHSTGEYAAGGQPDPQGNDGAPASNGNTFRVSAGSRLEAMQRRVDAALARDPERRRSIARRAIQRLEALQLNAEAIRFTGRGQEIRPLVERRTVAELDKEQAMRQAIRAEELTQAGLDALTPETRQAYEEGRRKLDGSHVVQGLLEEGKLMSKSEALRRGRESEYDGVPWLPPAWYGGSIMPDQAAQILYDKGLIREASPDALWAALYREVESARKQNAAFETASKAVAEIERQARNKAREEAAEWRREEVEKQKKDWSPRAQLVRDLRALDAILSVLPAEIRGKVGGFVKLVSLASDQARLSELQRRIKKIGTLLEAHLKAESVEALSKLIDRAQPNGGPGERRGGKITVEGHRVFAQVERVWQMSKAQADAELESLAKAIEDAATNGKPELIDLLEREQIAQMFANFGEKSAAEMDSAVRWLRDVYTTGRNAWRAMEEQRQAEVAAMRAAVVEALGSPTLAAIEDREEELSKIPAMLENGSFYLLSFAQVIESLLGPQHALAKRWNAAARAATAQKTDAILAAHGRFQSALRAAMGGKSDLEARRRLWAMAKDRTVTVDKLEGGNSETIEVPRAKVEQIRDGAADAAFFGLTDAEARDLIDQLTDPALSRKDILSVERVTPGTPTPAKLTEMKAVALTMLAKQEQYAANLARHGFTEDVLKQAEDGISAEGKALRAFFAKEYAEGYEPLARLFREMFGIDLPQVANYSPATFYHTGKERETAPFGGGLLPEGGFRAGFLKERKAHLAEPRLGNAFTIWRGHVAQMEHWKAFAPLVRELRGVLGSVEVKKTIDAARGAGMTDAITRWVDALEQNGLHERRLGRVMEGFIREVTRRQATVTLAWKAGTVLKQTLAVFNSAARMPLGAWLRGFSRVMRGKVDAKAIYDSPMIQRRLESGYSPEVRAAMASLFNGKPTRWADFVAQGLDNLARVDAFFTSIGTAIVYDYHLNQGRAAGLSEADAQAQALTEAEDSIGRTAQPTELIDRSLYELGMSPLEKVGFMFASEARKNTAMLISAAQQWKAGKITKADALRVLTVAWLANGLGSALIGAAWRDATDDDDDEWFDWENWNPIDIAAQTLLGPVSGIPLLNALAGALLGFNGGGPFQAVSRSIGDGMKLLEADKTEPVEKTVSRFVTVLNGAAMLVPQAEALAVGGNILKQAFSLVDNFTPDTSAETDKKERAKRRKETKAARE